jgi:GcrA cell cycle regulator
MSLSSPGPGWTDTRVETLTTLWRSGLSASQIARALGGVTRNAVIGKLHRLGLAGRAAPQSSRPIRAARAAVRPARARRPSQRPLASRVDAANAPLQEVVDSVGAFDLATLAAHACRWPIGDPRATGFGFCGEPVNAGPYCEAHRRRAFRPAAEPLERDPGLRRLLAGVVR